MDQILADPALRAKTAISGASSARSARRLSATCQPTMAREYKSVMKAVHANPENLSTYVMSATQRVFGADAVKSRSSRSDGREPTAAGTVMRGSRARPDALRMPSSLISRSTVHGAASMPYRRSWRHTFCAPYTFRPYAGPPTPV